jgi:hypothetical protein
MEFREDPAMPASISSGRWRTVSLTAALLLAGPLALPGAAHAGGVISFGDDQSISIGLGIRTSFTADERGAPDGKSWSSDFNLDSVRLYISGSVNKWLKATFNTERASDGTINILDGYVQFEPMDELNLWIGRMLPPSDRSNLDGPYYLSTYLYPGIVSQYPAKFDGRDDGATIWGKLDDKKLVYSAGIFDGHNRIKGASNQSDNMLFAGRIAYNFWDPEPDPAYYTSSTYYGAADILTLAIVGQYQADGVGSAAHRGGYKAWNVDGLFEKKYDVGVVTLEGAYYQFDTDGVTDVATNFAGAGPTDNVGGITQGNAFLLSGGYMFPGKVGWGFVQPVVRYQEFDADLTNSSTRQWDFGMNYVIDGHNARVTLDYALGQTSHVADSNEFVIGIQVQI